MANARLGGYTPELPLGLSGSSTAATNNCGNVVSSNANWDTAHAGSSESQTANTLSIGVATGYTITRSFLQFEIPDNLASLDADPQLTLYADSITGDNKIFIGSINYGVAFATPWSSWTAANAWDSVQTATSAALYTQSAPYATLTTGLNTLTLSANSGLAKFQCLTGGITSDRVKYITIALINYTYDRQDSAPSGRTEISLAAGSHANAPTLILQKPWFVNNRGAEPKYTQLPTYVIEPYNVGINQHARSVPQLPFSTAIKGPISLRGKNVPYKVTT